MSLPNRVLSPEGRSPGFGVFYTVYYGALAALVSVAGWLRDFTGDAKASVLFGGLLMFLTVFALAGFRMLQRHWHAQNHDCTSVLS